MLACLRLKSISCVLKNVVQHMSNSYQSATHVHAQPRPASKSSQESAQDAFGKHGTSMQCSKYNNKKQKLKRDQTSHVHSKPLSAYNSWWSSARHILHVYIYIDHESVGGRGATLYIYVYI